MSRCRECTYDSRIGGKRVRESKYCPVHGEPERILCWGEYIDYDGRTWRCKPDGRWRYDKPIDPEIGEGFLYTFRDYSQMISLVEWDQGNEGHF